MPRFFSIKTIRSSGLGDQLGTQFMRLYRIGTALGFEFVWDEMYFPRSIKPDWYERKQIIFYRIRFLLFKYCGGRNIFTSGINALLLRIESRHESKLLQEKDSLAEYLSLPDISAAQKENSQVYRDIILDDFFSSSQTFSKGKMKEYIRIRLKRNEIPRLCWTAKMWELIPQIDEFLACENMKDFGNNLFSKAFAKNKTSSEINKCNVVFHIRCGDSTTVHLPHHDLIVYDKFLFSNEKQLEKIFKIDSHRKSILPAEFLYAYSDILKNNVNITVISDGFDLTYRNIFRNLLKRRCNIELDKEDRKSLMDQADRRSEIFNSFIGARLIIGENESSLKKSISAISEADMIIWGIGGFALTTHTLFGQNKCCKIINIKEYKSESNDL